MTSLHGHNEHKGRTNSPWSDLNIAVDVKINILLNSDLEVPYVCNKTRTPPFNFAVPYYPCKVHEVRRPTSDV